MALCTRFATMPDSGDQNVSGLREYDVTDKIARCAEADRDLPNFGTSAGKSRNFSTVPRSALMRVFVAFGIGVIEEGTKAF